MQSYTVRQTISQFTGHQLALPTTINFYYVESASDALAKAVQQSGLAADLLEVTENEVVPMGTSLRTFEDWHTPGDDQIRSSFPAMALSDEEIARRQSALDEQRTPQYAPARVGSFNVRGASVYISDAEMAALKARVARRQAEKEHTAIEADPQTRYDRARYQLEQAETEFQAARTALHESRRAELAEARRLAVQSQAEHERRMAAPLNPNVGFQLMR